VNDQIAAHLPPHLREALLAEIDPGEELRWCARPSPEAAFRRAIPQAVALAALGVCFGALMLYASWMTWREFQGLEPITRNGRPTMFAVWAFVVFGCVMAVGGLSFIIMPWSNAAAARRTIHALTSTRVLTITTKGPGRTTVTAIEPGHPLHITRHDLRSGLGTITIYPQSRPQNTGLITMLGIPNAREADRLIRATFDPK
jgi:hypothetical protein